MRYAHSKDSKGTTRVVDESVLILGLDQLYRNEMQQFEVTQLLPCARKVLRALKDTKRDLPIEGYYVESPQLTEYFLLIRTLQNIDAGKENVVKAMPEFQKLWEVTHTPLYGRPRRKGKLLPVGRDPLSEALQTIPPNAWDVSTLVSAAYDIVIKHDDISLVGLATRTKDACLITALRESVVLYAEVARPYGLHRKEYDYDWQVDAALVKSVNRFIEIFNNFVPGALPKATPSNAEAFFEAYQDNSIEGRCVRIGHIEPSPRYYHWAIRRSRESGKLEVDAFWSDHIWTSKRYQEDPYREMDFDFINGEQEVDADFSLDDGLFTPMF